MFRHILYCLYQAQQHQLGEGTDDSAQSGYMLLPFAARLSSESIHCQGDDCTEPRGLIEHRFEWGSFEFEFE